MVSVLLLMTMLYGVFLSIQNHKDELLYALMLRRLLVISLLTHMVILLLMFYKGKQFVHISAFDTVHNMLEREQIDRENILSAIPVGVAITSYDDDGRILWCNQLMSERLGMTQGVLIGKSIGSVYQTYTPEMRARLLEQLKDGQNVRGLEVSYVDTAGTVGHAVGNVFVIEYEGVPALLTMLRDVTAVRKAKKAAERSNSAGVVTGKITHDFNNLLGAMKLQMYAGIGKLGSDHPAETHFQQAAVSVKEVSELVNELCNYASLDADATEDITHEFNNLLTVMKLQLRMGMRKLSVDHPSKQYFQQTTRSVKDAAELVKKLYHSALFDSGHRSSNHC